MEPERLTGIYKELADWHERQRQAHLRDRFLVLAADSALAAGRYDEAERLRTHLLQRSPHHLLRPFASFADAMRSPDVQNYVNELRRSYPPGTAEDLLQKVTGHVPPQPPARPTRALPPTAPVLDLDAPPDPPPAAEPGPEPLKVYRVQDEAETDRGSRPAPPPPRPSRPHAARLPLLDPVPPRPPRAEDAPGDADDVATGSWLSLGLFVLTLAAGLALAGYSLLGPFLPRGWGR
jgi:hypothetical protein